MRILPAIPEQVIKGCEECRHCSYDSYYSCGTDSGYDCWHPKARNGSGIRIVNDGGPDMAPTPITIPDWCPLEEAV